MQLGILLGLIFVIGVVALFIIYFINSAMDTKDASIIDEVPENHLNPKNN
ncbi:hypothetical protein [Lederbergia graminis]|uniref:Uncharacterized protein n=1 Tax=Lederbergia graminis TaxID=735518 RepID=A0ABW0LM27_9BACI|nr:hypothetical protein [Paenibacillus bovis]